jgi:hypothetical protein
MKEKYVVWRHGSIAFSGNAVEFKDYIRQGYQYDVEYAIRRIAELDNPLISEERVLQIAESKDNCHIEVNLPFANNPRMDGYLRNRSFLRRKNKLDG